MFLLGFMPDGRTRREQPNELDATAELEKTTELEMYDDGRYLTFTGDHLEETPRDAEQRNSAFRTVHEEYLAEEGKVRVPTTRVRKRLRTWNLTTKRS